MPRHRQNVDCKICLKKFFNPKSFFHHDCQPIQCRLCDQVFQTRALLSKHSKSPHEGIACDLCEMPFKSPYLLKMHQAYAKQARPKVKMMIPCTKCEQSFSSRAELAMHSMTYHTPRQQCHVCEEIFTAVHLMESHLKEHRNTNTCCKCDASFLSSKDYSEHTNFHLEDEKPFHCEQCKFSFSVEGAHSSHMKLHRVYFCEICHTEIVSEHTIMIHKASHEKYTSAHICAICDAFIKDKADKEKHMKKCHIKVSPIIVCL